MLHKVNDLFFATPQDKQKNIVTLRARCGRLAKVQWKPNMRIPQPGQGFNVTNEEQGKCPDCFQEEQAMAAGVGGSFLQGMNQAGAVEETQVGDVLGGYTREGEDQIDQGGRTGKVAVVSGMPIISSENNHGQDALGGYGSTDGMGRAVEVNDERVIEKLKQQEAQRGQ